MEFFIQGAGDALTPSALISVIGGILLGYIVGVLPGLSRPAALSVAVPLTYSMSPIGAIAFLVGVTKASAAGGATGAILLNTPGEPSSAATTFDGYPLAKKGEATRALKVALYASVFGDLVATFVLILFAASLARFALKMGPVEMTTVMIFALSFIAALSGSSLSRGIISGVLGLFSFDHRIGPGKCDTPHDVRFHRTLRRHSSHRGDCRHVGVHRNAGTGSGTLRPSR